jgi:hypothetical protein
VAVQLVGQCWLVVLSARDHLGSLDGNAHDVALDGGLPTALPRTIHDDLEN